LGRTKASQQVLWPVYFKDFSATSRFRCSSLLLETSRNFLSLVDRPMFTRLDPPLRDRLRRAASVLMRQQDNRHPYEQFMNLLFEVYEVSHRIM
jgi:hypothetical protein